MTKYNKTKPRTTLILPEIRHPQTAQGHTQDVICGFAHLCSTPNSPLSNAKNEARLSEHRALCTPSPLRLLFTLPAMPPTPGPPPLTVGSLSTDPVHLPALCSQPVQGCAVRLISPSPSARRFSNAPKPFSVFPLLIRLRAHLPLSVKGLYGVI